MDNPPNMKALFLNIDLYICEFINLVDCNQTNKFAILNLNT